MTMKTRYFAVASLLVVAVGLGSGLLAYLGLPTIALSRQGGPEELGLIPSNASLVAYADVREIMISDLRQRVRALRPAREDGQREFEKQTGINLETDVDRIVAAVVPGLDGRDTLPGSALVLVRGRFDEVRIEALMRDQGGQVEHYGNRRVIVAEPAQGRPAWSAAFLEPGLVAVGATSLLHSAIDLTGGGASVTTNDEVMGLVRDLEFGNAWAVGRFDVLASRAALPPLVRQNLPAISWFSASARIDSGVRGVVRAQARDEDAANGLRDVVRGFMALGRLQASSQPGLQSLLQSLDLGGTGRTVGLSFNVSPEVIDALEALVLQTPRPDSQPVQ